MHQLFAKKLLQVPVFFFKMYFGTLSFEIIEQNSDIDKIICHCHAGETTTAWAKKCNKCSTRSWCRQFVKAEFPILHVFWGCCSMARHPELSRRLLWFKTCNRTIHSMRPSPDVAHLSSWLSLPNDSLNREMQSTNAKFNFQITRGHRQEPRMESLSDNIKSSCPHLNKTRLHELQDGVSAGEVPTSADRKTNPAAFYLLPFRAVEKLKTISEALCRGGGLRAQGSSTHTHTQTPNTHIASTDMPN